MKISIPLFIVLLIVCLKPAQGQDRYSSKFSIGVNTGWYKLATFDLTTNGGCCNSVNVEAEVNYVNTWTTFNADVFIRFRQHRSSMLDAAYWRYDLNGVSGELLKLKKLDTYLYELWGYSSTGYGHFSIEISVTQENPLTVSTYTSATSVTDTAQEDVAFYGDWFIPSGILHIGTTDRANGYHLAVAGKAIAEEVVVKLQSNWPDYVFSPNYELPPLPRLATYIRNNRHLPGIPPASEVKDSGIALGEMNKMLLEKVEELTLYLIRQNELLTDLKEKNELLEKRVGSLETNTLTPKNDE